MGSSHRHRGGDASAKKKEDSFLDTIYSSAAGSLPSAYSAWKPGDPTGGDSSSGSSNSGAGDSATAPAPAAQAGSDGGDDDFALPGQGNNAPQAPPPRRHR